MMTESDSTTSGNAIIGSTSAEFVSIAITPSVVPKLMAPVSPIKNLAGYTLNHKKVKSPPDMAAQNIASSMRPIANASAVYAPKQNKRMPPANPSRPSDSFTENALETITSINRGIYHHPISKSPTPGTCKMLQSSLV